MFSKLHEPSIIDEGKKGFPFRYLPGHAEGSRGSTPGAGAKVLTRTRKNPNRDSAKSLSKQQRCVSRFVECIALHNMRVDVHGSRTGELELDAARGRP